MVKQAEFTPATVKNVGDIQRAYGGDSEVIIEKINHILSTFPEYDGLGQGVKRLKKQTDEALKKAKKAKKHIDEARKLLAEIEKEHLAISETILDVYHPALSLKARAELTKIAKENDYLTPQRQQDALRVLGLDVFNPDSMLKLISRSLDCPFWGGEWDTTPRERDGIDEYLYKKIQGLWEALEENAATRGKMAKAAFVESSIGGNEKTLGRFKERRPVAKRSRTK